MVKYQNGLIAQSQKLLKTKDWYNQRFDGCLNLIWMISELEIKKEARKTSSGNFTSHFCIFENHRADWYIDLEDIKRVTEMFLRRLKNTNHLGKKVIKKWSADEQNFYRFINKIKDISLEGLDSSGLKGLYADLAELYQQATSSSSLIDGFALGSDEIIQKEINELLDRKNINKNRGIIFSALTAPIHQSFINQAEISLLTIAAKTKTLGKLSRAKKSPEINALLKVYQKNYFWIKNNYHDNYVLTVDDFIKEIRTILLSKINISREISRLKNTPKNNRSVKSRWLKKLKVENYLKNLLEISEDFTHWQDERKKRTFLFTHYASWLLTEIGRRFGHSLPEMKYLARAEVMELLSGRKFSAKELATRAKKTLVYQKGDRYEILSGSAAEKVIADIFKKKTNFNIQDFRGLPASTGKARGRAKIIKSVKEVDKVKSGDILVAVMTRPDYIAGLKKAAAIVTDEGGITCHAAIIARELGTPCIIGTKIATQVLHDGDLVEVNANHGWVRKLDKPRNENRN